MVTYSAIAGIAILGGAIVIAVGGAVIAGIAGFVIHKRSANDQVSQ